MLYYLRYGPGWTGKKRKGTYAFGDTWQGVVQGVLQGRLISPQEMYEAFAADWVKFESDPAIEWGSKTGWRFFLERSRKLAEVSFAELRRVIGLPSDAVYDERFTYPLAPGVRETVIPDYVGPALGRCMDGSWLPNQKLTVVDWKTSDREYGVVGVELDEQLTTYQVGVQHMLQEPVAQVGLCVFVYQALPKVQWILRPARPREVVEQFVASAIVDDQRIRRGEFPRNPNACFFRGRCEMVPLCYESQRHLIEEELVKPETPRNPQSLDWLALDAIDG